MVGFGAMEAEAELGSGRGPLPVAWEVFCAEVVCGCKYTEAAERAGYVRGYAAQLAGFPQIQERIKELRDTQLVDSIGVISRVWAELQYLRIIRDAMDGTEDKVDDAGKILRTGSAPDHNLARLALGDLAKLRGWIVERKLSARATLPIGALGSVEFDQMLSQRLESLNPADREKVKSLAAAPTPRGRKQRRASQASVVDVAVETEEQE